MGTYTETLKCTFDLPDKLSEKNLTHYGKHSISTTRSNHNNQNILLQSHKNISQFTKK